MNNHPSPSPPPPPCTSGKMKKKKVSFKPTFTTKITSLPLYSDAEEEEIFNLLIKVLSKKFFIFGFNEVNRLLVKDHSIEAVFTCPKDMISPSGSSASQLLTHLPLLCFKTKCPLFTLPKDTSKEISLLAFPTHKRKPFISIFALLKSKDDDDDVVVVEDKDKVDDPSIGNNHSKLLSFIHKKNPYIKESQ